MTYFLWLGLLLLGWLIGILVNYFSDVLPWKRKLVRPFCLQCDQDQNPIHYFLWKRKCPHCGYQRGARSWLVELLFIVITLWLWENHPSKLGFWGSLLVLGYFGVVVVIDIEHHLILHPVSMAGVVLGFFIGLYLHGLIPALVGGGVGFGVMLLLYWLGEGLLRLLSKWRGQTVEDVALGFGDVNLSGVLGLMLGFPGILLGLFLAILLGGAVSLVYLIVMMIFRRYKLFTALPYGPFLVSGTVVLLFFRDFLASLFG